MIITCNSIASSIYYIPQLISYSDIDIFHCSCIVNNLCLIVYNLVNTCWWWISYNWWIRRCRWKYGCRYRWKNCRRGCRRRRGRICNSSTAFTFIFGLHCTFSDRIRQSIHCSSMGDGLINYGTFRQRFSNNFSSSVLGAYSNNWSFNSLTKIQIRRIHSMVTNVAFRVPPSATRFSDAIAISYTFFDFHNDLLIRAATLVMWNTLVLTLFPIVFFLVQRPASFNRLKIPVREFMSLFN